MNRPGASAYRIVVSQVLTTSGAKKFQAAGLSPSISPTFAKNMKNFFLKYINNRYFYTGLAFLVWLAFFDNDSILEQIKLSNKINDLKQEKSFYQAEIQKNKSALKALKYDTTQLEKYAREKYFMKKDNEDVYVIVRKK